jgi:hypothetical protein
MNKNCENCFNFAFQFRFSAVSFALALISFNVSHNDAIFQKQSEQGTAKALEVSKSQFRL